MKALETLGNVGEARVEACVGDLLEMAGPGAAVVPVNTWLYLNGGIAKQASRRAGASLEIDARRLAPLPIGNAVVLSPKGLACHLILAPTVRLPVDAASPANVAQATRAALRCADANSIVEIFFPALGTGTGGVPYDECAARMVSEMRDYLVAATSRIRRIVFVAQSPVFFTCVKQAFSELVPTTSP